MTRRRALQAARWAYVAVLLAIVVWLVWSRRDELAQLVAGARPGLLGVALLLGLGLLVVSAGFWTTALAGLGSPQRWATVVDAAARSVPARYVPGSVWYAVGRAALLHRAGASKRAVGAVAVLESALSMVVMLPLGAVLLLIGGRIPAAGWQVVVACGVLAVVASPPVVNRMLRLVARMRGGVVPRLTWGRHLRLLAWMTAFWLWHAMTFVVYLSAFPGVDVGSPAQVAGSFMLAWGVGYLAVFAPQGAGVFEVTVAALLTPDALAGVAVIVGGYRALMAVRDALAFAATSVRAATRRAVTGSDAHGAVDAPDDAVDAPDDAVGAPDDAVGAPDGAVDAIEGTEPPGP